MTCLSGGTREHNEIDYGAALENTRLGGDSRTPVPPWPEKGKLGSLQAGKDTREVVAIKCVAKKSLNKASVENLLTEIEILKGIRHPHIVQLKDFQWDSDNIYLIMEFCAGGDLSRFIHTRRILPERVARVFMQHALQFLHERNISHLDLKPQNILLSSLEKPHLKLAGTSASHSTCLPGTRSMCSVAPRSTWPPRWCVSGNTTLVWTSGPWGSFCTPPFASRSFTELEEKIRSNRVIELPLRPPLSRDCRDLLQRLLERDPNRRISFQDFFAHPWVDLEHMPSGESLARATALVVQAVKKDQDGDAAAALSLYCQALDFFVPALHYEVDAQRKEAIKAKVGQYVSRAEELKAIVSSSNQALLRQGTSAQDLLREMARDKPRLLAALEVASAATAKEEEAGGEQAALDLYQHGLGELLVLLAAEPPGRRRELLHTEVQNLMARAEYLKEQVKVSPSLSLPLALVLSGSAAPCPPPAVSHPCTAFTLHR
ncbi:serine/threonine-protein kinase ULK3 isoform X4 [Ailuropoda melanoleuca]|uniref:serine/threonine-protein kinase ULK3 isoform X4 n=1 Tax=Ailuropoda melanoleuca TaxID=9646 RepID=UPI0014940FEF|nr:serine/threonine-protein kinase ULK3 isoform X4 [Ailuropoda melanoleuca]